MTSTHRPNFVVFMTDHQRGDTQPAFGGPARMPNLERLWRHGVCFTEAYCTAPHCCPSRASFFSGLFPSEHGVWNNVNVSNALSHGPFDGVRLFSEDLRDAGYDMLFSGKWHIDGTSDPSTRGFRVLRNSGSYREYPNLPDDREWAAYAPDVPLDAPEDVRTRPGQILRPGYPRHVQYRVSDRPYGDAETVDAALAGLDGRDSSRPFFLFVGPQGPHDPYTAPQEFLDLYPPGSVRLPANASDDMADKPALYRRTRAIFDRIPEDERIDCLRHYLAACSYEDHLFGRLLDGLEARQLLGDTVVLYLSDHGDYAGEHGLWAKGLPCFRGAYHICATVGFGGLRQAGDRNASPVSIADFAPTFLELAGVPARTMSGRSLAPLLRGESPADWRRELCTQTNGNEIYGIQRAVFDSRWKYVFNAFDFDELYDLANDPGETRNLAADPAYADKVAEMCTRMWRFARDHRDNCVNPYIMTALAPVGPGFVAREPRAFESTGKIL